MSLQRVGRMRKPLAWNSQGPRGAQGETGPPGPKGEPGSSVTDVAQLAGTPCAPDGIAGTLVETWDDDHELHITCRRNSPPPPPPRANPLVSDALQTPLIVQAGSAAHFDFTVTNAGDATAGNVIVTFFFDGVTASGTDPATRWGLLVDGDQAEPNVSCTNPERRRSSMRSSVSRWTRTLVFYPPSTNQGAVVITGGREN